MVIDVRLQTILQRQSPQALQNQLHADLPENSRMGDLLPLLQIEMDSDHLLSVVNGKVVGLELFLEEIDQVNLMPALSGGAIYLMDKGME